MDKVFTKVVVQTYGGNSLTADDDVEYGQGDAARISLQEKRDVIVQTGTEIKFAPYKAIDFATITMSTRTVPDPIDDVCQ